MLSLLALYLGIGAAAGILAGLLGIGGGVVIVPMLAYSFRGSGFPAQHVMHLALGTSLASIIFTSASSFLAHHRRGAVHWRAVRRLTPGIIAGTLAGAYLASLVSSFLLQGFFGIFLIYTSLQFLVDRKPQPGRELPGRAGMFGTGSLIGILSSMLGIGGGTLSVPVLVWCNISVHHAIGTAAAVGFPIALAGTLGYTAAGWQNPALPPFSLGYIYLPALAGVVGASILTAPLGVRLAHWLPVGRLKRIFAALLLAAGARMLLPLF